MILKNLSLPPEIKIYPDIFLHLLIITYACTELAHWNLSQTVPRNNGNLALAKKIYCPEDPKFKYLYETEPACNGKKYRSFDIPLEAGFTV
jgi:hypothetical protein